MQAEIISVGTEILLGDVVDTNASYIAQRLALLGIDLFRKIVVGDNKERLSRVLKESLKKADLIIITGGLGPTEDDLTKEVVSELMGQRLVLNKAVAEQIKKKFPHRKISEKTVLKQALIPSSAKIISNNLGSAPGIIFEEKNKMIILLPGVPREMKRMMQEEVIPYLSTKIRDKEIIKSKVLKIWGIGESQVEEKISPSLLHCSNPTIGLLAKEGEVHLRITAKFPPEIVDDSIKQVENKLRVELGDYIYGVNEQTLEEIVASWLTKKKFTIAVAESCTGGLVSHRLTNVAGSSNYFHCGIVSYSNQAKVVFLKVDEQIIKGKGAVSLEVAKEMALGARVSAETDLGLGITGIAGPTGATTTKPVGLVCIALSDKIKQIAQQFIFSGNREQVKWKASQAALDILRRYLEASNFNNFSELINQSN